MNVQSRFRDLDATAARPKGRQGWMARHRASMIVLLLVLVALGGGYYWYTAGSSGAGKPVVVAATRADVEDVVTAVGNLQPLTSVDVGAQVSGQLDTLHVQIGDDVQKGQLLAEIDSSVMAAKVDADNAQLQNYQAQLAEKQSQLALTKLQADRQTRLMKDNATSQDAFDSAEAAATTAAAQVKSVQAQIQQSESTLKADKATLSYSKIYAPMTGTVSAIPAKQGQTLNANQQAPVILTIADLSTMTVFTQVSEADVAKLRLGMDAYFTTLGNGNRRYTGKLRQILPTPTVTNNVVLYTALFDVANPNKQLMTQMTAQVFFVRASARDAVIVPVAALHYTAVQGAQTGARAGRAPQQGATDQAARAGREAGGGGGGRRGGRGGGGGANDAEAGLRPRAATLTVVKDDGTQETRDVMVGVTDRVNAQIISGLAEGEQVIAGQEIATRAAARPAPRPPGLPGVPGVGGFR
jgi:macrolide-specific efflux system membrane fusion protein